MRELAGATAIVTFAILFGAWWHSNGAINGRAVVTDGDTLRIGSHRIRLFGIDAPEMAQTCGKAECGVLARNYLIAMIGYQPVSCRRVGTSYDRIVGVCHTTAGLDLSEGMVRSGWAIELKYFSHGRYEAAEREARAAGAGVWSLPFRRPSEFRAEHKR